MSAALVPDRYAMADAIYLAESAIAADRLVGLPGWSEAYYREKLASAVLAGDTLYGVQLAAARYWAMIIALVRDARPTAEEARASRGAFGAVAA